MVVVVAQMMVYIIWAFFGLAVSLLNEKRMEVNKKKKMVSKIGRKIKIKT